MGSGVLFAYPEIATICGVQGLLIYVAASALPFLVFAFLTPHIRRKCPDGFLLTEWTRQRYGPVAALYLSFFTLVTMFLYMVSELSALQQIITALTGLNGLGAVIVQVVVTTIYTAVGGFRVSFITDNFQAVLVLVLVIIATIAIGTNTHIDTDLIDRSGLTRPSLLGWQLMYILPMALVTNAFFVASYWLRAFASRSDRDLQIGSGIACVVLMVIFTFIGFTGLLAVWSGSYDPDPDEDGSQSGSGSIAFFLLLNHLPNWTIGIVLVLVITLSSAAFDSLQSAMTATSTNDLFRSRLPLWSVRLLVVIAIIPVVVLALRSPDILTIYLICDLVSASLVPPLVIGLSSNCPTTYSTSEVVIGGLGGILSVFGFGLVYYDGDASKAGQLLILQSGLYVSDWSVFGAFVAAPVGALVCAGITFLLRLAFRRLALFRRSRTIVLQDPNVQPTRPAPAQD